MTAACVVIVGYRTAQLTVAAARSAIAAGAAQVIVVDNGSHDETSLLLNETTPRVEVINNSSNVGFGTAANIGAARGIGGELIFLNSDAELTADSLTGLLAELARHDGRCIVGPRLIDVHGVLQNSAGLLPRPTDLAVRALGLHAVARWIAIVPAVKGLIRRTRIAREYGSAETARETIGTNMVSGACFGIGRSAFAELGGFDERFFMYFEDADLCRRAANAGMPIRYVPEAVVTHIGGGSSSEDYHFGPLHARSMRQYLGKWYGPRGSALAVVLLWLRAVGFTLALRPGSRRAWRAWWAALRDEDPRG